jgi:hypothetical protein
MVFVLFCTAYDFDIRMHLITNSTNRDSSWYHDRLTDEQGQKVAGGRGLGDVQGHGSFLSVTTAKGYGRNRNGRQMEVEVKEKLSTS